MNTRQLNIAICDDEYETCAALEDMLEDIAFELHMKINCFSFHTGRELMDSSELKTFDILFLDMELPDINGIKLGQMINDEDIGIRILVITSVRHYSLSAYNIRPYGFILKPFTTDTIKNHLLRICRKLDDKHVKFSYISDYHTHYVSARDIILFESNRKKISMTLDNGMREEFYDNLDSVLLRLPDYFCRISKKHIINCRFVTERTKAEVRLSNDESISIGSGYRQDFEAAMLRSMALR